MRAIIRTLAVAAVLAVAIFVATVGPARAACTWADPGANRFTGDPVAAVEAYTDIPPMARRDMAEAVKWKQYTAVVDITRDSIGGGKYLALRDMHWGTGQRCTGDVDRQAWPPGRTERGLVFCRRGHCVIIPTVCGNVARVNMAGVVPQPDPDEPALKGARKLVDTVRGPGLRVRAVPEPGSISLVGTGLFVAALIAWRQHQRR